MSGCYVANVVEIGEIKRIEKPTVIISDEEEQSEAMKEQRKSILILSQMMI